VLITTDDQATTDLRWMPQTRRLLGQHGVRFTNFISPNPLCCPARASILTGQYSQNNGVRANSGQYGGFPALDSTRTVATWLRAAGYHTGFVGKYLNLYAGDPPTQPGWEVFDAITSGLYQYFDYTSTGNGAPVEHHGVHSSDMVSARTADMIEQFGEDGAPFFIWASYVAPHGVCGTGSERGCVPSPRPAVRHQDIYTDETAPDLAKPSFNEDVRDKPRMVRGLPRQDRAAVQSYFTERIRSLASVDEAVAATVSALREAGRLDNTVIVFTSDNGFLLGEHRHIGKVLPYRESISVPLLVRGPGIPGGQVRRQAAALIDLAPTFAALAGVRPDLVTDGRNLMPYARADVAQRARSLLLQTSRGNAKVTYTGVKTRRYTFVRWRYGFTELYDHRRDPSELTNVAHFPRYRPVRTALAAQLRALRDCSGAECRRSFPPPPRPRAPRAETAAETAVKAW
jgi:N-acetylglucosamine-6-sulfatase